jgi:hypothetical protein
VFKKTSFVSLLLFFGISVFSQNVDSQEFEPFGEIIVRSFINFSQGFGENSDKTGFDITRAFLGYSYKFSPTFSATLIIDGASDNAGGTLEPAVRNAFVSWTPSKLTLNAGGIELYQFSEQEKYWRLRYMLPTFQALYRLGHAADWGVTASWKFNKFLTADVGVVNGEGFKKLVQNSSTRYFASVSVYPINDFILRAYADIYNQNEAMRDVLPENLTTTVRFVNQSVVSLFAGYQNAFLSSGIECNKLWNKGFVEGKNIYGVSGFASVIFAKKLMAFARYDLTLSQRPDAFTTDWNATDGQIFLTGVQFQPVKHLKFAPNFRYYYDKFSNQKTAYLFVNMEFNL